MKRKNHDFEEEKNYLSTLCEAAISFFEEKQYEGFLETLKQRGITEPLRPPIKLMSELLGNIEKFPGSFPHDQKIRLVNAIQGLETIVEYHAQHAQSQPLETEEQVITMEPSYKRTEFTDYVLETMKQTP